MGCRLGSEQLSFTLQVHMAFACLCIHGWHLLLGVSLAGGGSLPLRDSHVVGQGFQPVNAGDCRQSHFKGLKQLAKKGRR